MIEITIDGRKVEVPEGTTLWEAARLHGIEIPALCHDPRYRPVGVCRMCVVDVGERALAASCVRPCEDGMTIETTNEEIESHRNMLASLLAIDQPRSEEDPREVRLGDNELLQLARGRDLPDLGIESPPASARPADDSSRVIAVDHSACILCDRCSTGKRSSTATPPYCKSRIVGGGPPAHF